MKQIVFLIFLFMGMVNCSSQDGMGREVVGEKANDALSFFQRELGIPFGFVRAQVMLVEVDQKLAYLFRYDKPANAGFLREHFSFLVTKEQPYRILGFTAMDTKYADEALLSNVRTREIAIAFLGQMDPDLLRSLENLWIAPHEELVQIDGGEKKIIGMKYKCFRKSHNDYSWVIVGFDGSIITFERDIIWDNARSVRVTNQWLHDDWIVRNLKTKI